VSTTISVSSSSAGDVVIAVAARPPVPGAILKDELLGQQPGAGVRDAAGRVGRDHPNRGVGQSASASATAGRERHTAAASSSSARRGV